MIAILAHTPLWVFALFAVLLALGVQALRPRAVAVWRLLVVPGVFIAWGFISLVLQARFAPLLGLDFLMAAAIGGAIAWVTTPAKGPRVERADGLVRLPGSAAPLVRNLVIFAAKYGLGAVAAMVPAQAHAIAVWDLGVSGASAGYFLGWLVLFALSWRRLDAVPAQ